MGLQNVSFDDRDRDHLSYSPNWFFTGSWNASNVPGDPTGTLTSSDGLDANVTFTFPQPANAFYYYAFKRSNGGLYAICIDCDPNNPNFEKIDALGPDDGKEAPILLFSKTFGDFGVHEIILTNQNDTRRNPAGTSQITVDRFEIQVQDDSPDSSSSASSLSSSSVSSSSASASATASSSPSNSTPVGAIAGGVIGGLALIALCAILLLCIRRQRKRTLKPDTEASVYGAPNTGSSFATPYTPSNIPPDNLYSASTETYPYVVGHSGKHHTPTTSTDVTRSTEFTSGTPSVTESSGSRRTGRSSRSRRPRREVDAGRIVEEGSEFDGSETLPPEYDQVFRRGRSATAGPATPGPLQAENPDDQTESVTSSGRRALPLTPQRLKS